MAIAYRVLGQSNPSASTLTTVYTVPASTSTIISTVVICNQASTAATFSVAVQVQGSAIATKDYINYQTPIPGNDSITLTLGMTLGNTDVLSVNFSTSTMSVNVFGSEIS
jgi:glucose-6-phosphate dehydrogenase assembly protein OpcA